MPRDDYLVIGLGRFGLEVGRQLMELGKHVTVLDKDSDLVQRVGSRFDTAVAGDSADIETLRDLGVGPKTTVIVAIGEMDPSIMTCSSLSELGVKNIYVKAKNIAHKRVLSSMAIENVIVPEIESGRKLALQSVYKIGMEFSAADADHAILRLTVANPAIVDRPLKDLDLKRKTELIIVAIVKKGKLTIPYGEVKLSLGDEVILLTPNAALKTAIKLFDHG